MKILITGGSSGLGKSLVEELSKDKKNQGNKIGCILPKCPGEVEKVFIDNNEWLKNCIIMYSNSNVCKSKKVY